MGAYEYVHACADSDHDGMLDADELAAGTDPLNPASRLEMGSLASPSAGDQIVIRWSSVSNRFYSLLDSTNLLSGFAPLQCHIPAYPPENVYTDTLNGELRKFYRIEVEP